MKRDGASRRKKRRTPVEVLFPTVGEGKSGRTIS